jgi:hypothetical protein
MQHTCTPAHSGVHFAKRLTNTATADSASQLTVTGPAHVNKQSTKFKKIRRPTTKHKQEQNPNPATTQQPQSLHITTLHYTPVRIIYPMQFAIVVQHCFQTIHLHTEETPSSQRRFYTRQYTPNHNNYFIHLIIYIS